MTNRDLIKQLLEFDLDSEVALSISEEYLSNFKVREGYDDKIMLTE
ncbi:hypothetical protein PPK13_gp03 [Bacillus phage Ray17]|uniref:Uncharacterized protein n=1 Tax=Bacillus phage Ray17 TaxID=2315627 RepID=A0A386K718_9CAUD|nr:hypothetical protein PPK13_gp03 [Bacillus phage Ray17]AYD80905.1 hypothetical protein Ray17_4 [Bacillus phage Ray17]